MKKERWRPVKGFEDSYEVSDHGRVRSLPRYVSRGVSGFWVGSRIMKYVPHDFGYKPVQLSRDGKRHTKLAHRLVAEVFLKPPADGKDVVMHRDDNPANNYYKNLKWGTLVDNNEDMYKKNRNARGMQCNVGILTDADVLNILKKVRGGATRTSVAVTYGVSQSLVSMIALGQRWSHLTGIASSR